MFNDNKVLNMSNCTWCNGPDGSKWNAESDGKKYVSKELFCSLKCKTEYDNQYGVTWEKSGCFIATAVYGDYNHPIVQDLRVFRNESLYTTSLGRKFVSFYYKYSPNIAAKLEKTKTGKFFARNLIVLPLHSGLKFIGYFRRKNN